MAGFQTINSPETITREKLNKTVGSSNVMAFPSIEAPHFMYLQFVEYQRTDPEVNKFKAASGKDVLAKHFILPLPSQLVDAYRVSYNGVEFGLAGTAITAGARGLGLTQDVVQGIDPDAALSGEGGLIAGGKALGKALSRKIAALGGAGVSGAIDRAVGAIINPHLTTTFERVELRTFNFTWKVYPQSAEESYSLRNILSHIKLLMHPVKPDSWVLDYPYEVYGQFYADGEFLFRIGRSVVTQLTIDYAPEGAPSFFKGTHAPTVIQWTMGLQEVAPLTQNDLGQIERDAAFTAFNNVYEGDRLGDITQAIDGVDRSQNYKSSVQEAE